MCACVRARACACDCACVEGGGATGRKKEGSESESSTFRRRSLPEDGGIQGNRLTSARVCVRMCVIRDVLQYL